MKAIILSAGQGSRLLPLTEDRPKCLLAFGDDTILGIQLKALKAGGVSDVAIVTGFRTAAVEKGRRGGDCPWLHRADESSTRSTTSPTIWRPAGWRGMKCTGRSCS